MKYPNPKSAQRGASLVEYSLLVALIAVIVVGGVEGVGRKTKCNYETSANAVGGTLNTQCLLEDPEIPVDARENTPSSPPFGTGGGIETP